MLYHNTLNEIEKNTNPGVEYEIALFARLIESKEEEYKKVLCSIDKRSDKLKVLEIQKNTNIHLIVNELRKRGYSLLDASFETQNDEVGPSDIVMIVEDNNQSKQKIGISVKYANTCTLNVTGKSFISDTQIFELKEKLPQYTRMFIEEMSNRYGSVSNWFRVRKCSKTSKTTETYIDLIRDAVIVNWPNVQNKEELLSSLFHSDSPIEYWVFTYTPRKYKLNTNPPQIDLCRAKDIIVMKYKTSYVAFYLDGIKVGHMQVKFNNSNFME